MHKKHHPFPVTSAGLCLALIFIGSSAYAHDYHAGLEVVPEHEYELGTIDGFEGPAETIGVSGVDKLGVVDLGEEFPPMDGFEFRAREITIEPGGVIAVHQHDQRPGFAYILEGEIIEHRNDHPEPLLRTPGQVAVERTGVVHWWENKSDGVVRALIVDIVRESE